VEKSNSTKLVFSTSIVIFVIFYFSILFYDLIVCFYPSFRLIDEIITVTLLLIIIYSSIKKRGKINKFSAILVVFVLYTLVLWAIEMLPLINSLQILISIKFLVFLTYFYSVKDKEKYVTIFEKGFYFINILTIVFIILQYTIGKDFFYFFSLLPSFRGNMLRHTGIFRSPIASAYYLLIGILYIFSKLVFDKNISKFELFLLILDTVFFFLSLLRRSWLSLFVILIFVFIRMKFKMKKLLVIVLLLSFIVFLPFLGNYFSKFNKVNNNLLNNDKYLRRVFVNAAFEIMKDKFPFGSGPGTFGTKLSVVNYSPYYYKYGLNTSRYFSDENKSISVYDSYLASIMAEYGFLGICFYFYIFFVIFKQLYKEIKNHYFIFFAFCMTIDLFFQSLVMSLQTTHHGFVTFFIIGLGLNFARKTKMIKELKNE